MALLTGLELFLLSKRLLRLKLATANKASVTCFVTFANFACTRVCKLTKLRHLR